MNELSNTPVFSEILAGLGEEKTAQFTAELKRISREVAHEVVPEAIEEYRLSSGISDEVAGLLQLLASRSSDPRELILKKALTLYVNALDYVDRGDRLAILSPDDTIVREIVGIGAKKTPEVVSAK